MKTQNNKTDTNPFLNADPAEVWKSLLSKGKRITREEFNQKMKEAIELQKEIKLKAKA